jgi:thiosulfate reductase cytochrome b subunit
MTQSNTLALVPPGPPVHPGWLRVTHWVNVIAVTIMITSGWRIYNASPLFALRFPSEVTIGGWLGGALQWHFAGMWLLMINGLCYLAMNLVSGRLANKFFPIRSADVVNDLRAALHGTLSHADPRHYNGIQRLAYLFVLMDLGLLVISGVVVWKSVQFPLLRELLGGYDTARLVHFVAMGVLLAFGVGHVLMVALVPRTLLTMLRGR